MLDILPRWLRWSLGGLLVLVALGGIMIRTADHDPALWHVDPLTTERTGRPNDAFVAADGIAKAETDRLLPPLSAAPEEIVARLAEIALTEPRTEVVAGAPGEAHMTFVQRSALFGFPDYVSARAVAVDNGSALAIWSRSRYGYSDMGVNAARLERWLSALTR